jgi:hypothetical protein
MQQFSGFPDYPVRNLLTRVVIRHEAVSASAISSVRRAATALPEA